MLSFTIRFMINNVICLIESTDGTKLLIVLISSELLCITKSKIINLNLLIKNTYTFIMMGFDI